MPKPQSAKSHVSIDPFFHYVAAPIFLVNLLLSIYITSRQWPVHSRSHLWWIVVSIGLVAAVTRVRIYALKVQDRVIRLEERFRFAAVLPVAELSRSAALTLPQIIALRFASDAELPGLVTRTLDGNLTSKQIKESITSWQPDNHRV